MYSIGSTQDSEKDKLKQQEQGRSNVRLIFKSLPIIEDKIILMPFVRFNLQCLTLYEQRFPLIIQDGTFKFEIGFMNYSHRVSEVVLNKRDELINVNLEKRPNVQEHPMDFILDKAQRMLGFDEVVPSSIKSHFGQYTDFMKKAKITGNQMNPYIKRKFKKYQAYIDKKRRQFLKQFPCLQIKYRARNNDLEVSSVGVSTKTLQLMGWSQDKFITQVFERGIPNFTQTTGNVLHHYCECESNMRPLHSEEHNIKSQRSYQRDAFVTTKSGKNIRVQYKMFILPVIDDGEPGIDRLFTITGAEEIPEELSEQIKFNLKQEVEMNVSQEKERLHFANSFYNEEHKHIDSLPSRICQIKHLDNQDIKNDDNIQD